MQNTGKPKMSPLAEWVFQNLPGAKIEKYKQELGWGDYTWTARINLTRRWTKEECEKFSQLAEIPLDSFNEYVPDYMVSEL
ncbi:MAG: hypothetical protein AAFP77_29765 [Bacteroidota bacterium]